MSILDDLFALAVAAITLTGIVADPQVDTPPAAETTVSAEPPDVAPSSNWMEELLPEVDPNGYGSWYFERRGAWGASDGYNVYIDPDMPEDLHYDVMAHELGHVLQERYYGDMWLSPDIENEADCIAILLGASWTNYSCSDYAQAELVLGG